MVVKHIQLIPNILLLLVLFPYISIVNTSFDTQPWALIFSMLIPAVLLLTGSVKIPRPMFIILLIVIYATVMCLKDYQNGIRSLFGYLSLLFLSFAGYHTFKFVKAKYFVRTVWVWLAFGVIQFFYNKQFGSFMLARLSTTDERGVTSLAVEPSYYAITCIYFLIINDIFYRKEQYTKKKYIRIAILLTIQILISYSALGLMFLSLYYLFKVVGAISKRGLFRNFKFIFGMVLMVVLFMTLFSVNDKLSESRAGIILEQAMKDPISIIYHDYSTAQRFAHVVLSFDSIQYNYGLGFGLGTWNDHVYEIASHSSLTTKIINHTNIYLEGRTMSAWGAAIYEIGIGGVALLLVFFQIIMKGKRRNKEMKDIFVTSGLTIFTLMLMSVPLAYPLFGYMLGVLMYYAYKEPFETVDC